MKFKQFNLLLIVLFMYVLGVQINSVCFKNMALAIMNVS